MLNKSLFLILLFIFFVLMGPLKAQEASPVVESTEQIVLPSPTESPSPEQSPLLILESSPSPTVSITPVPSLIPIENIFPEIPEAPIPSPPLIPSPPPLPDLPKMPEIPKPSKPQIKKPYKKIDFNKLPLPEFAD